MFKDKKSIVEHIENSHKEVNIKYLCNMCGDKFNNIELLLKHSEKNHEKKSIFTCEECNDKFHNKQHLPNHKQKHHSDVQIINAPKGKTLPCDQCKAM